MPRHILSCMHTVALSHDHLQKRKRVGCWPCCSTLACRVEEGDKGASKQFLVCIAIGTFGVQQVPETVAWVTKSRANVWATCDGAAKPLFWVRRGAHRPDLNHGQVGALQLLFGAWLRWHGWRTTRTTRTNLDKHARPCSIFCQAGMRVRPSNGPMWER